MPTSGVPDQQATPNAIMAMPATRATGMVTPASSSPNNNCPTSEGTISNANPVAASPIAAKINTFFIVSNSLVLSRWQPNWQWLKTAMAAPFRL
jgi:hypothetical protein